MSAIQLSGNVTISQTELIDRPLTLDLNGKTLATTQTGKTYMFRTGANGKLTLTGNGTINGGYRIGRAENGGEITIENGTYTSAQNACFEATTGGKVTVNGGTLTGPEGAIVAPGHGGIVEVNGGVLEGLDNFAIATNRNSGNDGNVITVNGGQLIGNIRTAGYEAIGVYIANADTFVMNGGEIIAHGGTALCMRGGDVTINDGTLMATGVDKNGNPVADGQIADDGTIMTGVSAIVYHRKLPDYVGGQNMKLTINGGTITGADKSIDVISDETEPKIFVNGGTLIPAYAA